MANTQNTQSLANVLAGALALSQEDLATLTTTLIALGNNSRMSAPVAPTQAQESAPQTTPSRNTTRKECMDTEVHVACMGKGHVKFFVVDENGKEQGVATRYMRCVKDLLRKSDVSVEWDKEFEREDVYARDYVDNEGIMHAKGTHKHGAYVLVKNGKAMAQTSVKKWVDANAVVSVSAADAQVYEDKRVERNIKRNERDARKRG